MVTCAGPNSLQQRSCRHVVHLAQCCCVEWIKGPHHPNLYLQVIKKKYYFIWGGVPNTSESVKHKFWDCTQARWSWRWATFIMHELCGVRIGKYDIFHWKQAFLGEESPKKLVKNINILHLLRGIIPPWTIWVEWNDKAFNHEQWHQSKMKHLIWDNLIMYAKVAWATVVEFVEVSVYSSKALLQGFDDTWVIGTFFVNMIGWKPCGSGNNDVHRLFVTLTTWWLRVVLSGF